MKDLFRAARGAAGGLVGKAQRLVPGGKSDVDDPSDDEDDDDLPEVNVADPAHEDLARLDEEDPEPMAIDTDRSLFDDLREIDLMPPLPLVDVHEAGFASLILRMDKVEGTGLTRPSGPLLLVSILAPGFSETVEHEAQARGIAVEAPTGA